MKIAVLVNEFPSLSQTFIQSQIIGLLDCGHDVNIYTGNLRGDLCLPDDVMRYHLLDRTISTRVPRQKFIRAVNGLKLILKWGRKHPLPVFRSLNVWRYGVKAGSLNLLYQMVPVMEHGPYDIIHCQFGTLGLQGLHMKQVMGGLPKLVTSFRGFDATMAVHNQPECYKELFAGGELFLPVSHSLKQRIIQQGCPAEKIVVLPSGIDCQKIAYSKRTLKPGQVTQVVSVGRLVEKKGFAYAIEAVVRLIESGRRISYDIVGEGKLRNDLERLIAQKGIRSHVRLLGRKTHDEVLRLLGKAHILIAPSVTAANGDQEGIPNILKEAMAMGMPVIGTRHSGIPELVKDGVSGFLVEERDVEGLAERLGFLIDHPERWGEMGKAGRLCVATHFDSKTVNARLVDLYRQIVNGQYVKQV